MKKVKIGLSALALIVGICSAVATKAKSLANTAYWKDINGTRLSSPPDDCDRSHTTLCATAYDISNNPTGDLVFFQ